MVKWLLRSPKVLVGIFESAMFSKTTLGSSNCEIHASPLASLAARNAIPTFALQPPGA